MPQTCIITDNSAQFPQAKCTGRDYIFVLPMPFNSETILPSRQFSITDGNENSTSNEILLPHEISQSILNHSRNFQNLIFLLSSHSLVPTKQYMEKIINSMPIPASVDIIDSQTTGFGLGWLVQICADQIAGGMDIHDLKRFIYNQINKIYTLFYFQNLSSLKTLGVLEEDQAFIGDLLGIRPLVLLEKGNILPYQKVRTTKHFIDAILDYAHEFEHIHFIGFHFGSMISTTEKKSIIGRVRSAFPKATIDSQPFNKSLNSILGSQTLSAIFIEKN